FSDRWIAVIALRDRRRNRREERAEAKAEREALELGRPRPVPFPQPVPEPAAQLDVEEEELPARGVGRLLAFFRRKRSLQQDPLDVIPAYQRETLKPREEAIPITARKPSIWERGDLDSPPATPDPAVATSPAIPAIIPPVAAAAATAVSHAQA